jgi:hypothetical protein
MTDDLEVRLTDELRPDDDEAAIRAEGASRWRWFWNFALTFLRDEEAREDQGEPPAGATS